MSSIRLLTPCICNIFYKKIYESTDFTYLCSTFLYENIGLSITKLIEKMVITDKC